MAALGTRSCGDLLQVLTDVYRGFLSRFGPEPSCRDVAVLIRSGLKVRVPAGDMCCWELTSISLSLVKNLCGGPVLQNLPAESAVRWEQVLRVLVEDLGLMSQLVGSGPLVPVQTQSERM